MYKPCCSIGQRFGLVNKANGIVHTGIDHSCGFGSTITATFGNEYVYKVLTKENPANDGTGFTGVFTIVDNGVEVFEYLYGHCNPSVTVGQILAFGDVLGTEANNGEVYSGGVRITLAMQKAGDTRGTHRHDQKRILRKTTTWNKNKRYITAPFSTAAFFKEGYYYEIPYINNGFSGCVDWTLPLLTSDLYLGRVGYDVLVLQRILKKLGFLKIDECTDVFGGKTLAAVVAFQKAHGITPALGYVGSKTRAVLLSLI